MLYIVIEPPSVASSIYYYVLEEILDTYSFIRFKERSENDLKILESDSVIVFYTDKICDTYRSKYSYYVDVLDRIVHVGDIFIICSELHPILLEFRERAYRSHIYISDPPLTDKIRYLREFTYVYTSLPSHATYISERTDKNVTAIGFPLNRLLRGRLFSPVSTSRDICLVYLYEKVLDRDGIVGSCDYDSLVEELSRARTCVISTFSTALLVLSTVLGAVTFSMYESHSDIIPSDHVCGTMRVRSFIDSICSSEAMYLRFLDEKSRIRILSLEYLFKSKLLELLCR